MRFDLSVVRSRINVKDELILEADNRNKEPFIKGDLTSRTNKIIIREEMKL